jgi:hypothetical protein
MEEFLLILTAVIMNTSKTGGSDILGSSAYFVKLKMFDILLSNEDNYYFVEMV